MPAMTLQNLTDDQIASTLGPLPDNPGAIDRLLADMSAAPTFPRLVTDDDLGDERMTRERDDRFPME